jgi:hypothetical protein
MNAMPLCPDNPARWRCCKTTGQARKRYTEALATFRTMGEQQAE